LRDGLHPNSQGAIDLADLWYQAVGPTLVSSVTAPVSSSISASPSQNSATITWTTDKAATSQVEYGLDTSYGTLTALDTATSTNHSVSIAGLSSGTTYDYAVISTDVFGNTSTSSNQSFNTVSGIPNTSGYGGASYVPMYAAGTSPVGTGSATATSTASGNATTTNSISTQPADLGCLPGFLFSVTTGHSCATTPTIQPGGASASTETHYSFLKNLSYHATGGEVLKLQQYLASQGLFTATPNSIFGPITLSSLIKFQKLHAIVPASGYFGPITRAFINGLI